jgi:subtilisin family serine protease
MTVTGLGITTDVGTQINSITDTFGGTSSATPLVAGIAALVISANPALTALEVIGILKQTAAKDLDTDPYPRTAPTSFDPDTSWDISPAGPFVSASFQNIGGPDGTWSPWFGHGRVGCPAGRRGRGAAAAGAHPAGRAALERARPGHSDNVSGGCAGSIVFTEAGRVAAMRVRVDLRHLHR